MKIDSALLSNLGISSPNARPDSGDGTLFVPPAILFQIEPINPTLKLVGGGATSENSINTAVQQVRNNQVAGANTLITFTKGLYELDLMLSARFDWTPVGTAPHTIIQLKDPSGAFLNSLLMLYAFVGVQTQNRKFRILFGQDGWQLVLNYGATGVAEHVDLYADCQITRLM